MAVAIAAHRPIEPKFSTASVQYVTVAWHALCYITAAGHRIATRRHFLELLFMAEKAVSQEALRRLWSEIALLRQEIGQAERDQTAPQVRLTSAIAAARRQLQSRSDRHR